MTTVATATDFGTWFAVYDATNRSDFAQAPHSSERELRVFHGSRPGYDSVLLAAEDAGETVGVASVRFPLRDNVGTAFGEVVVRPDRRGRGVGTALTQALERIARDRGRVRVIADIRGADPSQESGGTAFADQYGYTRRMVEIMRVQRAPFSVRALDELEQPALAMAEDYRIATWRGKIPEEYVDEFARLAGRMSTDIPLGDLDYEPEVWDAQRVRNEEDMLARTGRTGWCAIAVAPDGTIAGQTEIVMSDDDDRLGLQKDTLVDPQHRGRNLGLLLKIANLRALLERRPELGAIWTWNNETNSFMNSINNRLGYIPAGWIARYQRDL